jgi:hypothetical protein
MTTSQRRSEHEAITEEVRSKVGPVLYECLKWNVPVIVGDVPVSALAASTERGAPKHDISILWPDGLIVIQGVHVTKSALMHELAHVCIGDDPEYSWELEAMLWLEYATARKLGYMKEWEDWMNDYGLDDGAEWGSATVKVQRAHLKTALEYAVQSGLANKRGQLTYQRVRILA